MIIIAALRPNHVRLHSFSLRASDSRAVFALRLMSYATYMYKNHDFSERSAFMVSSCTDFLDELHFKISYAREM